MAAESASTAPLGVVAAGDSTPAPDEVRTRWGLVSAVLAIGLLCTATIVWAAWLQDRNTTTNLLRVQTQQAGDVLISAIPSTVSPLDTAGELAANSSDPSKLFRIYMAPLVAPTGFKDASFWSIRAGHLRIIAELGARSDLHPSSSLALSLVRHARPCSVSFSVAELKGAGPPRFGFACSVQSGQRRFLVYAERPLPANRHAKVAANSAFSELRYANYFGSDTRASDLIATDFASLPPSDVTSRVSVPFGDTTLTLVTAPNGSLAGSLADHLPWLFGAAGLLLTLLTALATRWLDRRRQAAEIVSRETRQLNVEIGRLLAEQRTIAETLQRSLLPQRTPSIPGLQIEARYVPGSDKLEVGGDWYSVVRVDDRRFGFVVGDVSGHGVQAAAVMAALRFTIRSLMLEGHSPRIVLDRCSAQVRDLLRGHFATVLIGVGDLETRRLLLANAGHLNPLLVSDAGAHFLETTVGVPVGVPNGDYELASIVLPKRSTLLAFTDGLVERRGVSLDVGLERLRAFTSDDTEDLNDLLTRIIDAFKIDQEDDVAILALRWP